MLGMKKKPCATCAKPFVPKKATSIYCGVTCYKARKSVKMETTENFVVKHKIVNIQDLPSVEYLPAAYLKQCADYWDGLVDNAPKGSRIA